MQQSRLIIFMMMHSIETFMGNLSKFALAFVPQEYSLNY